MLRIVHLPDLNSCDICRAQQMVNCILIAQIKNKMGFIFLCVKLY